MAVYHEEFVIMKSENIFLKVSREENDYQN